MTCETVINPVVLCEEEAPLFVKDTVTVPTTTYDWDSEEFGDITIFGGPITNTRLVFDLSILASNGKVYSVYYFHFPRAVRLVSYDPLTSNVSSPANFGNLGSLWNTLSIWESGGFLFFCGDVGNNGSVPFSTRVIKYNLTTHAFSTVLHVSSSTYVTTVVRMPLVSNRYICAPPTSDRKGFVFDSTTGITYDIPILTVPPSLFTTSCVNEDTQDVYFSASGSVSNADKDRSFIKINVATRSLTYIPYPLPVRPALSISTRGFTVDGRHYTTVNGKVVWVSMSPLDPSNLGGRVLMVIDTLASDAVTIIDYTSLLPSGGFTLSLTSLSPHPCLIDGGSIYFFTGIYSETLPNRYAFAYLKYDTISGSATFVMVPFPESTQTVNPKYPLWGPYFIRNGKLYAPISGRTVDDPDINSTGGSNKTTQYGLLEYNLASGISTWVSSHTRLYAGVVTSAVSPSTSASSQRSLPGVVLKHPTLDEYYLSPNLSPSFRRIKLNPIVTSEEVPVCGNDTPALVTLCEDTEEDLSEGTLCSIVDEETPTENCLISDEVIEAAPECCPETIVDSL